MRHIGTSLNENDSYGIQGIGAIGAIKYRQNGMAASKVAISRQIRFNFGGNKFAAQKLWHRKHE